MIIQAENFTFNGRPYGYRPQYVANSPREAFERFDSVKRHTAYTVTADTFVCFRVQWMVDGRAVGSTEYTKIS